MIDQVDKIIYIHINDQHPDTLRFVNDCAEWFGKPVEILQSPFKSVEDACIQYGKGYINGPAGAECSRTLKKKVRREWEKNNGDDHTYIWGLDADEENRIYNIFCSAPEAINKFPLMIKGYSKQKIHQIMEASGIKRPEMYDLGYLNNNCIGCVKGGMAYWNKIRVDFPEVFKSRAELERKVGATCLKDKNGRIYLDELDPKRGRGDKPIVPDCGLFCEQIAI